MQFWTNIWIKKPISCKHFLVIAIDEFDNKLTLKTKIFRVDFDEDTRKYFIRIDHDYFKKQALVCPIKLYKWKCELNRVIKDNTDDEKLKMIPIVIHKCFD